ncbi:transposable element Tcb1 transposase [Trichonephila clavipes]|nr:transposable element Tcb1 transposase [Trichonephila clavipes]
MAKFSYLPENKRYKIIHLKKEGYSMCQIAAKVPCGLSTVVRTLKRFSETNFIADRGRSGHTRPRKTSLREDRLLLSNRKLNSSQILKQWTLTSNVSVCPRTVRGRLLEIGLRGCKARPKSLLTEFQRKRRLTWAREHSLWTIKYWEKDDNAPCHRAKVVQKLLEDHTVNRMNWPGQYPDLNPIESLWFKIGYEISKKKPSNKRELIEALIFSFNHIVTKDLLLKLMHSMPKRCRAVIKANGWPLKY